MASGTVTISYDGLDEIDRAARQCIDAAGQARVWLFNGAMGAGKTTFIKALGRAFGVVDTVNSPTFALVNEYEDNNGQRYYHFDFYRIKNQAEALDMGVEEYLDSGSYCFIEWPQQIESLIDNEYISIDISPTSEQGRQLLISKHE